MSTPPPWAPAIPGRPVPPADRAYRALASEDRRIIRDAVQGSGIAERHHAYLARCILAKLKADDPLRPTPLKTPTPPSDLITGYPAELARQRIDRAVDLVRAARAAVIERRRDESRAAAAGRQWDNEA